MSRDILGDDFTGTLVTDCHTEYDAHAAGGKQKCLSHLAPTAHDWQKLSEEGSANFTFLCRCQTGRQTGLLLNQPLIQWNARYPKITVQNRRRN